MGNSQLKKNLIYHICGTGNWRWNIEQLKERIHHFNGIKIAAVSYGEDLANIQEVQEILPEIDHWVFEPNDLELRESVTLLPMLQALYAAQTTRDIVRSHTFFGHTKGTTRGDKESVRIWTELCYQHNLDRIPEIEKQLQVYHCTGTFKTTTKNAYFPKESRWHYSGSFWWGRTDKIFERNWNNFPLMRYTFEAYPSLIFNKDEAGAIFANEGLGDMYRLAEARKWQAKSEVIFNQLASKKRQHENETSGEESSQSESSSKSS